ncbi:MAG: type II toxin-antitoxin system ParD family antitoxin [Methylococcaceae bacterium]|nr:type II toxin-antitoxin system ParD family antitoxin [Methylococcaceae bacterium]
MPKTSISISDHFDGFIATQIADGRYDTASEVIRAALRLLEAHEMDYKAKQAALRIALMEGEASEDSLLTFDEIITSAKQKRAVKRADV